MKGWEVFPWGNQEVKQFSQCCCQWHLFISLPFLPSQWLTYWFILLVEKNFQCSLFNFAQKLKEFFKLVECLGLSSLVILPAHYAPMKSKLENPPFPGIWIFEDWIIQIPALLGENDFQMPYPYHQIVICLSSAPPKEQSLSVPVVCNKALYIHDAWRH